MAGSEPPLPTRANPGRATVDGAHSPLALAERKSNIRALSLLLAGIGGGLAGLTIVLRGLEGVGPEWPGILAGVAVLALALGARRNPLDSGYLFGLILILAAVLGFSSLLVDYDAPLLWTNLFCSAPLLILSAFGLGETSGVNVPLGHA